MIVLDTQVCIWWSIDSERLSAHHRQLINTAEHDGIAISAITFWEVGMLVARGRISLNEPLEKWMDKLLSIPTLHVVPLTPQILVDSTRLPGEFHKDPADRMIVATARSLGSMLLTTDALILAYQHVRATGPDA